MKYYASGVLIFFLSGCMLIGPSAKRVNKKNIGAAPFDAIIVPGVPFDGKTWSATMKIRVHWSVYLYEKGIAKNIIYSGSAVYTEYEEAKIMALYAEQLGIPKNHIFTESRAEHSTENVYYSYRLAKVHGFEKLALATDPFQSRSLRKFIKKFELPVKSLPIIFDTMRSRELKDPVIDPTSAKRPGFVSIKERESFGKRLRGTFGQNIRWQEEDLKTRHLRKKYSDRIEK